MGTRRGRKSGKTAPDSLRYMGLALEAKPGPL